MAIFNAWCDRMPIIILGATGPVDAAKRRPWIEWIHTNSPTMGAIVRTYTKWGRPAGLSRRRTRSIAAGLMAEQRRAAGTWPTSISMRRDAGVGAREAAAAL